MLSICTSADSFKIKFLTTENLNQLQSSGNQEETVAAQCADWCSTREPCSAELRSAVCLAWNTLH